jgi:hypothetical protein
MPTGLMKNLAKKEGGEGSKPYKKAIRKFETLWNKAKNAVDYEKSNPAYWPTVTKVFMNMVKSEKN